MLSVGGDVVTVSTIMLLTDALIIWVGTLVGLLIKHFYTTKLTEYAKNLVKLKNYKNYTLILVGVALSTSVFGTTIVVAILATFEKFPLRPSVGFLIGTITGLFGISTLKIIVNTEVSGDGVKDVILRMIYAKLNIPYKGKTKSIFKDIEVEENSPKGDDSDDDKETHQRDENIVNIGDVN